MVTIIGSKIYLVPENHYDEEKSEEPIEISRPEIIFSIMEEVPILGGGCRSSIFHRAKAEGLLLSNYPKKIKITSLSLECEGKAIRIKTDDEYLERHKKRYIEMVKDSFKVKSTDWLDNV